MAFVNVSNGVGVGIAIDGKLLRGAHNTAGEFGHVPLDMHGPRCSCGQRGCWESYVSNRATIARYLGAGPSWPESEKRKSLTVEDIIARARAGEARALDTLRETGEYLGRGLATIVKAINPGRIYVGGEITAAWDLIEPTVRSALAERVIVKAAADTEIVPVAAEEHPRLRGASALVGSTAFSAAVA